MTNVGQLEIQKSAWISSRPSLSIFTRNNDAIVAGLGRR
jgi:hypothetical protein